MKIQTLLILAMLLMLVAASDEFKNGDTINLRVPYIVDGIPTTGAWCRLDLYSELGIILGAENMTDTSNGWYNYTIDWLTDANGRWYTVLVYCQYNNRTDISWTDFDLVQNTQDEWSNLTQSIIIQLNQSAGTTNELILNMTVQSQNNTDRIVNAITGLNTTIGQGNNQLTNLTNILTNQSSTANTALNSIYSLFKDYFEFSVKDEDHYNLWIASDYNFTDIIQNRLLPSNTFDIVDANLPNGQYYTKVRRYSSVSGIYGVWSDTVNFTMTNSSVI